MVVVVVVLLMKGLPSLILPRCSGNDSVRIHEKIEPHRLEDVLENGNDLKSQHILPDVIANLENRRLPRLAGIVILFLTADRLMVRSIPELFHE